MHQQQQPARLEDVTICGATAVLSRDNLEINKVVPPRSLLRDMIRIPRAVRMPRGSPGRSRLLSRDGFDEFIVGGSAGVMAEDFFDWKLI